MRYFLVASLSILLFNCPIVCKGQISLPLSNGEVIYSLIDSNLHCKADKLFAISKEWMVRTFKNSKDVVQSEDKSAGRIIGKYEFAALETFDKHKLNVHYQATIQIDVRNNKARIKVFDIYNRFYDGPFNPIVDAINRRTSEGLDPGYEYFIGMNSGVSSLIAAYSEYLKKHVGDDF